MLEIGCGWGGFAIRAAQTVGCRVTGLTISKEQLSEAPARVAALGLEDRVTLLFCDYRLCPGESPAIRAPRTGSRCSSAITNSARVSAPPLLHGISS